MTSSATPDPQSGSGLKRALLTFVVSVIVLDAIAIGIYYGWAIKQRPEQTQHLFIGIWMGLTLVVVVKNLKTIRQYRGRYRRGG